ncbi:hypothetical protein GFS60_07974 (plasmid) [Rhodococcus sp. WAY2]|nr:hypothetical protein GFS60_07974 [Rhodococcus sp. WAY2]
MKLNPEINHLHGLHINADGTVLAGTHTGLFADEPSGSTSRVGNTDDDLMGMTGVPGTNTVLSSGHPGRSSDAPNPLGLMVSTDGGQNWTTKSLIGEVDFHVLTSNGGIIVGFDGTTGLLVSTDSGTSWTAGASLPTASLAITDAGVWAVTTNGLQLSTDAARTFSVVPAAPPLSVVSAGTDGALWGVDVDGNAWRSRGGRTWQMPSSIGPVDALTASDYDNAYAATDQSLYALR